MSQYKKTQVSEFDPNHVSLEVYVAGFLSCIALTLAAYFAATNDSISNSASIAMISLFAVVQCGLQLRYFLHLGGENKPRWKLTVFIVMLAILAIFLVGSLWIMDNLNYRMIHDPEQKYEYVESQDGL
jgi:cytochrome o ubiquinol oxidase subunit IV